MLKLTDEERGGFEPPTAFKLYGLATTFLSARLRHLSFIYNKKKTIY